MIKDRYSEVTFANLPPLRVARFRAVSRTPEDDALKVLTQWAAEAALPEPRRNFGFDVEVTAEQASAGVRGYELWFTVPEGVWPAGPVKVHDFPGGRYATLTIHRPFDDPFAYIPNGWELLHEWVVTHNLSEPGEMLCLEEVVEREGGQDMILYHPVRS